MIISQLPKLLKSLSARRAWIEIVVLCLSCVLLLVALRKESVDRNTVKIRITPIDSMSLSARRAWIEIKLLLSSPKIQPGSLSARRAWIEIHCRFNLRLLNRLSLSARRAWIEIY